MLRFLLLTVLAALVLAQPEPAAVEIEEEPVPLMEVESEPDPDPEQEPGVEPVHLKDGPEDVVGGTVAKPNSWPWQVSLQSGSWWYGYRHFCGGTLIQRDWVLTAAHCVDEPENLRVVAGEHDLNSNSGREQAIAVSHVYINRMWDTNHVAKGYDIALLRLSRKVKLNKYVALGSLPPPGQILPNNNRCYITGWGLTFTGGSISPLLKQALLPAVDYKTCSRPDWWGSTIKESMVCAGGGALSGCQGDSGGPLNCQVGKKYYVHGIASFVSGQGCNAPKKPTVFTRVSAYIAWIKMVMAKGV